MSIRSRSRLLLPSTIALALTICGLVILQACETPVYRYAMYRWNPAPYEIYYFHNEPLGSETQAFHARIKELVKARPDHPILNAILIPVDLSKDPQLKQVLPDIKQLWTKHQKELSPGYLVTNPQGGVISIGTLAEQQLSSFSDSAQRRQLLTQLAQGKAAVMVLLSGQDPLATKKAEKELRSLVEAVNGGKVELYQVPDQPSDKEEAAEKPAAKPAHTLGLLTLDRQDPKEAWLIQSLLAVESDLKDLTEPMVFAVYGRARALPPYVGKGITRDNLLQCVEFITGACSCTVKEQNPGVDLLVRSDWETMAAQIADLFGAEEGNETQFGGEEFFPELIIGANTNTTATSATAADLRIFCADALRHPLGEIVRQYEQEHGVSIEVHYGSSGDLLAQIEIVKTGDLYLAADNSHFESATAKGLAEPSIPLASRKPVIVVAKDNTSISGIKDLLNPQVNVAIGDPEAGTIGRVTKQLLTASGDWEPLLAHVSDNGLQEPSADDVIDVVKQGRVTAGIVWDMMASTDPELKIIACPELDAGESSIEIAVLSSSTARKEANRFAKYVASPTEGLAIFEKQGFRLLPHQAADPSRGPVASTATQQTAIPTSADQETVPTPSEPASWSALWTVGTGVLAGLVLLFGITLFVMRRS